MIRPATLASTPTASSAPSSAASRGLAPRRRARTLGLAVATLGLTLVAGCTTQSPAQTQVPYQPADGVALNAGSVLGRDLLIVASAKGATGVLSGSVLNTGTSTVTVSFAQASADGTPSAQTTPLTLGPREQKRLTSVEIRAVATAPGALAPLTMTTSDGAAQTSVPVLPPDGYYSTLTPTATSTSTVPTTPAAPTPTGTAATGTATTTPAG